MVRIKLKQKDENFEVECIVGKREYYRDDFGSMGVALGVIRELHQTFDKYGVSLQVGIPGGLEREDIAFATGR